MTKLKRLKRRITGENIKQLSERLSAWRARELEAAQNIALLKADRDHAASVAIALSQVLFMIDDFDGCPDFHRWLQPTAAQYTAQRRYRLGGLL